MCVYCCSFNIKNTRNGKENVRINDDRRETRFKRSIIITLKKILGFQSLWKYKSLAIKYMLIKRQLQSSTPCPWWHLEVFFLLLHMPLAQAELLSVTVHTTHLEHNSVMNWWNFFFVLSEYMLGRQSAVLWEKNSESVWLLVLSAGSSMSGALG